MSQAHMNWDTGKVCHCPYAQHAEADPSFQVREASNLDQLKSPKKRPDLQTPEGQQWLNYLDSLPPKTDAIAPWMTREWKNGRLLFQPEIPPHDPANGEVFANDPNGSHSWDPDENEAVPNEQLPYIPPGPSSYPVSPVDVNGMADWHHSNHPNKEGVNIQDKDFQVPQMLQKTQEYQDDLAAKQREGYGEVVHQFPDNWSIRRLQNAEECSDEGKNMGHCAASYGGRVENAETMMYSLRDPKNQPHATFDVKPGSVMWQNPQTGEGIDEATQTVNSLKKLQQQGYVPTPSINRGTFNQAFGKEDSAPLPEYKDRIRQYMETMPEEERPRSPSSALPVGTLNELLEGPSMESNPYGLNRGPQRVNYNNILASHLEGMGSPDIPWDQASQQLVDTAHQRGELPQLQEAMQGLQQNVQRNFADGSLDQETQARVDDLANRIHGPQQQPPQTSFSHIFNTPAPPPKSQKLGNTTLEWEQTDKGAVMRITGHTHEDRALGRLVLASELARAGIELAQIPMDHDPKEPLGEELARIAGLHKEADWDDVQQKAKRLLDAGNVTLLRNGYNNVVTKVQGDHGTYDNEISRDDPNSRAITGWQCSCLWDDYSFGRTRQWKKYEARPCAHTLASYWKSVSSPLDPDVDPKIRHVAPGTLPTQGEPGGGQGMGPGGETQPSFPGMTEREGQPPEPQPGDQTSLFDQAIQRTPSLQNALQALDQAAQPEDAGIIPPNPNLELPEQPQTPQPGQLAPGEVPPPNTISAPGARPITIQNPIQIPSTLSSWQEDNWKISDDEPTNSAFQSGDAVRLEEPTYGVAQGKSEEHGAGGWQQIPKNSIGEVRGQDPTTGWVEAHFPLNNSGPMEPYSVKMFLDPSQVSTVNNRSPFVKRR